MKNEKYEHCVHPGCEPVSPQQFLRQPPTNGAGGPFPNPHQPPNFGPQLGNPPGTRNPNVPPHFGPHTF